MKQTKMIVVFDWLLREPSSAPVSNLLGALVKIPRLATKKEGERKGVIV